MRPVLVFCTGVPPNGLADWILLIIALVGLNLLWSIAIAIQNLCAVTGP